MPLTLQDQEHLKLLSIFHYIMAAITGLFAFFPLLYVAMGAALASGALGHGTDAPPRFVGFFFIVFGFMITLIGWTIATLIGFSGKFIAQRRNYIYCLIIAGLSCMSFPFGTALGVFTFVVLLRPQVKAAFEGQSPGPL